MNAHFLEPIDVLSLRGNRLFGDAGSYGESMIPPWPSAAAGAIRSAILARDGVDLSAFARGEAEHPSLGTPAEPGAFRLLDFQLAWRGPGGGGPLERLYPLPADLVASPADDAGAGDAAGQSRYRLRRLTPQAIGHGIDSSAVTGRLAVLAEATRSKPAAGLWLTERGLVRHLAGQMPDPASDLVASNQLWERDERIGIGMDPAQRRAADSKLFTAQAVAFRREVGFAAITAEDGLDAGSVVRLGGDGRGAVIREADLQVLQGDLEAIAAAGRCRIILTSPALFADGWRLPGMSEDGRLTLLGISGRVTCACVQRAEVVSGWDLARWQPKPAQRAVPAGSVYWIEDLETSADQLRKLADHGLWPEQDYDAQRRAEGFNRFAFASY